MATSPTDIKRPPHWSNSKTHFFKYTTCSTAKAVLSSSKLRWSTPTLFNDPFDIQFDLHIDVDRESVKSQVLDLQWNAFYSDEPPPVGNKFGEVISLVRQKFPKLSREEFNREFGEAFDESFEVLNRILPQTQKKIRDEMAVSKVLCLSDIKDNILMWSHYADEHKGLVLKFGPIPELDSAWGKAQPVQYTKNMPRFFTEEFLAKMSSGQVSIDTRKVIDCLVYSKAIDWAYEKEWRIYAGRGWSTEIYEDVPFDPQELLAVYFGCKMPDDDCHNFATLVAQRYPHAKIIQAQKAEREFELVFQPYHAP